LRLMRLPSLFISSRLIYLILCDNFPWKPSNVDGITVFTGICSASSKFTELSNRKLDTTLWLVWILIIE
jgi:hypothetical protein